MQNRGTSTRRAYSTHMPFFIKWLPTRCSDGTFSAAIGQALAKPVLQRWFY